MVQKTGLPLRLDGSFFATQNLRQFQLQAWNIQADWANETDLAFVQKKNYYFTRIKLKLGFRNFNGLHYYKEKQPFVFDFSVVLLGSVSATT